MKAIPVTKNFSKLLKDRIGTLHLQEGVELPYDHVLAFGFKLNQDGTVEVLEVSLISDKEYTAYLKHIAPADKKLIKRLKEKNNGGKN